MSIHKFESGNKVKIKDNGQFAPIDMHLLNLWINHKQKHFKDRYFGNNEAYKLRFEYFIFQNYSSLFDLIWSSGKRNFSMLKS